MNWITANTDNLISLGAAIGAAANLVAAIVGEPWFTHDVTITLAAISVAGRVAEALGGREE